MTPPKLDLSNFEDDDADYVLPSQRKNPADTSTTPSAPVLPKRRSTPPVPSTTPAPVASAVGVPAHDELSQPEPTSGGSARRRGVGRPRTGTTAQSPDRPRGSTLMVDASLVPLIQETAEREGLSRGELFIQAIEAAWDQLPGVLKPTPVGGSLFAPRPVAKRTSSQEGQVAMNYRLRGSEFDRLDELVDQVEAASRSQLINAAVRIHLAGPGTH